MKKNIIFALLGVLLLNACDPNKDIYNELDNLKEPYREDGVTYTLVGSDYNTISSAALKLATTKQDSALAKEIKTFLSFSETRSIANYPNPMNDLLSKKFPALNLNSTVKISYDYSYLAKKLIAGSTLPLDSNVEYYTLTTADYTAIGNPVDTNGFFYPTDMTKLLDYIKNVIIPVPDNNRNFVVISFKYKESPGSLNIETRDGYFYYDAGKWKFDNSKGYALTAADYDLMGDGPKQPGQYNNFSSDILPMNYLPGFLKAKFPSVVTAKSQRYIIYKYYSGGTETQMMLYEFDGSNWKDRITKTDQFKHMGFTGWFIDPTVTFTMSKSDYNLIVDYVKATPSLVKYVDSYGTAEYYYGASAYYGEFQMKLSTRRANDPDGYLTGKTDAEAMAWMNERVKEGLIIMLEKKFPNAQPFSNGIQVYYIVNYINYVSSMVPFQAKFKCTDVGKFEVESYVPQN